MFIVTQLGKLLGAGIGNPVHNKFIPYNLSGISEYGKSHR
jgi:hypothetical protein